jgi:hypothetical protein
MLRSYIAWDQRVRSVERNWIRLGDLLDSEEESMIFQVSLSDFASLESV